MKVSSRRAMRPPGYFLIALAIVKASAASVEMLRAVMLGISGVLSRMKEMRYGAGGLPVWQARGARKA